MRKLDGGRNVAYTHWMEMRGRLLVATQIRPFNRLIGHDSVESGIRSDTAGSASVLDCSISLDCEDANRAIVRIHGVEELAIGADCYIKIRSSGWIRSYERARECREASVCCD